MVAHRCRRVVFPFRYRVVLTSCEALSVSTLHERGSILALGKQKDQRIEIVSKNVDLNSKSEKKKVRVSRRNVKIYGRHDSSLSQFTVWFGPGVHNSSMYDPPRVCVARLAYRSSETSHDWTSKTFIHKTKSMRCSPPLGEVVCRGILCRICAAE